MRLVLALILATLLGAPTAHAAGKVGDFVVPASVTPEPLPAGTAVRGVKLARVMMQLPDGQPWASVGNGFLRPDLNPLVWENGRDELNPSAFALILADEFRHSGFKAESDTANLFEDAGDSDLQIGVVIDAMNGRFCRSCGFRPSTDNVSGAVLMGVEWQVYSTLERRVVARIRTTGGFETERAQVGNELRITMEAFRENTRLLLASPDFRNLVTGVPVAITRPSALPISVPAESGTRALSDVINASPVIFAGGSMGSGFLISREGYLVTNQHVVGEAQYVKVRWADGSEALGEVIRSDRRRDVALIKTEARGRQPLVLNKAPPVVGETVFAIGAPFQERLQGTVTKGIVSAIRTERGQRFIQSDVSINHGNSGGPLVNEKGLVVGLAVSGIELGEAPAGINFFIPIGDALDALSLTLTPVTPAR